MQTATRGLLCEGTNICLAGDDQEKIQPAPEGSRVPVAHLWSTDDFWAAQI